MLSRPLTLSQSEQSGRDKPGMAPPSEPPVTRNPTPPPLPSAEDPNAALPFAEDPNAALPSAEDPNAALPSAEDPNAALPSAEDPNAALPSAEDPNAALPSAEACPHTNSSSPPYNPFSLLLVSYPSSDSSFSPPTSPLTPQMSPCFSPPTSPLTPQMSPCFSPPTSPLTPQMSPHLSSSPSPPPNPVLLTLFGASPSSDSFSPQMFPSPPIPVSPNVLLSSPSPASSTTHLSPQMPPRSPPPSSPSSSPRLAPCSSSQMSPQMPPCLSSRSPPHLSPQLPPGPCVLCSSMLPRLLSSLLSLHQKEMKRLIEGAMATFDLRLSALERRLNEDRGDEDRGDEDRGDEDRGDEDRGDEDRGDEDRGDEDRRDEDRRDEDRRDEDRGDDSCSSWSEGEEPVAGPSQSGKRRRRREEKETRRKRRKHQSGQRARTHDQSEQSARTAGQSERRTAGQSERSVCAVAGQNGLRATLLLRPQFSSVSYEPWRAWGFSGSTSHSRRCGDIRTVTAWLTASPGRVFERRLPWRLSLVAVETAVGASLCDVTVAPERPLRDHSAPPYISGEHSYIRSSVLSLVVSSRRQRLRANHSARRRPLPLPTVPTNGLTVSLTTAQSAASADRPGNKRDVKRVSQIRIRRASPKESNLTPLGLPKVKRLKKKEFSLEEIYTNKNYRSPSANSSSLETIFEEPREKDGALLLIGQQRRRRLLHFPDFTQPRKRKRAGPGAGLVAMVPRKRAAARLGCRDDDCDSDVMLLQRLSALQDFLQRQGLDQD